MLAVSAPFAAGNEAGKEGSMSTHDDLDASGDSVLTGEASSEVALGGSLGVRMGVGCVV